MVTNRTYWKREKRLTHTAQDQTLASKTYKVTILKQNGSKKCKMCSEREETVKHILSGCSKLAQTEYTKHHDKVPTMVPWELCSKYGFEPAKHWYEHRAEEVMENHEWRSCGISTTESTVLYRIYAMVLCSLIRGIRKRSSLVWLYPGVFVLGLRRQKRYWNTKILHCKYLERGI